MATRPDDQAFPCPSVYAETDNFRQVESGNHGLSIREEFAKTIMAGFAAADSAELPDDEDGEADTVETARMAVSWADALIDALNEKKE